MSTIKLDLTKKLGKIKPMHATGQPPIGGVPFFKHFHHLTDIGVPYSRLHDVGGVYGGNRFVDVPNIFRDFSADENDPASYDFTFTDALLAALVEAGVEPYYRLGVTIENQAYIKSYRIDPPADYDKWARICEHIIAHYNEGWADGFHYNITYWEIWNESDDSNPNDSRVSQMWNGTAEDYYRLYDVTSKHLKNRFSNIKIGGYASSGFYALTSPADELVKYPRFPYFMDFFHGFMKYIKEHNSPIDFFSWHSYKPTETTLVWADWLHKTLTEYGYGHIETHLNEWNPCPSERGTAHHSAEVAAMMLGMQNQAGVDMLMIYDARLMAGNYAALFDQNTLLPCHAYYSLAAFNALYQLGTQTKLECNTTGVYAVAATDGKKNAILISNISGATQSLNFEGADLDGARWHVIDQPRLLSWCPPQKEIGNNTVILIEF